MAAATAVFVGGSVGPARIVDSGDAIFVPCTITVGATYATGGNPLTLPDGVDELQLIAVHLVQRHDGTRIWEWDGSVTAPKLKAYSAFATEQSNGNNTSGVTLFAILLMRS